jgi:uncharacterized protein YbjT (DUF2867 family)
MRGLVLGGAGFLGGHVVDALLARGHAVVIGSRHPTRRARCADDTTTRCAWRKIRFERVIAASAWSAVVDQCDFVVNCVGILRERPGASYDLVHHRAVVELAAACARAHVRRLVHVSALGLSARARSRFTLSKIAGEEALKASGATWTIVRPSLLDGDGGYGARWLRALSRLPLHFVPADALGRIAVVDVRDAAEAIAVACEDITGACREAELGGPDAPTMSEYLGALRRRHTARAARCVPVPAPMARTVSHLCDAFHVSPFSFGHLELMRHDNVPAVNALPLLLGRRPRVVVGASERLRGAATDDRRNDARALATGG